MQAIPLTLALVAGLALPAMAHETLRATIDFADPDTGVADAFFEQLDASDGRIIRLDLTLIPGAEGGAPGYDLTSATEDDPIICGDGTFGTIDNLQNLLTLTFQHPGHFHAPTTVHIGDRLRFPHHDVTCAANPVDGGATALHLIGDFIVETAEIPTAISYTLFPASP